MNKYRPGEAIRNPVDAISMIIDGHWFYWATSSRPKHPSVLLSMTVRTIEQAARKGLLRIAVLQGGYYDGQNGGAG